METAPVARSTRRSTAGVCAESAASKKAPAGSTSRPPSRAEKEARLPRPSTRPGAPPPHKLTTTPLVGDTERIIAPPLAPTSVTYTVPLVGDTASAYIDLKAAAAPTPSATRDCPLPASVAVAPLGMLTTRTRLLYWSATNSALPFTLSAMPRGELKSASSPNGEESAKPYVPPPCPPPASTLTTPPIDTWRTRVASEKYSTPSAAAASINGPLKLANAGDVPS